MTERVGSRLHPAAPDHPPPQPRVGSPAAERVTIPSAHGRQGTAPLTPPAPSANDAVPRAATGPRPLRSERPPTFRRGRALGSTSPVARSAATRPVHDPSADAPESQGLPPVSRVTGPDAMRPAPEGPTTAPAAALSCGVVPPPDTSNPRASRQDGRIRPQIGIDPLRSRHFRVRFGSLFPQPRTARIPQIPRLPAARDSPPRQDPRRPPPEAEIPLAWRAHAR